MRNRKTSSCCTESGGSTGSAIVWACVALLWAGCTGVIDGVAQDGGADQPDGSLPDSQQIDTSLDPCEGVDCGPNGACVTAGQSPVCDCDEGFHPEGLTCVEDDPTDPCEGVTCGTNAHCDTGVCVCDSGYEGDPETSCDPVQTQEQLVRQELVDIATAELGYCEGVDDRPYMQWQPGYWCYDFVSWVYDQCSYSLPSPLSLPTYYTDSLPQGWRPEAGDLIKYNIQHYGMVAGVSADGQTVYTIEGNVNSCVMERSTTDTSVEYYGSLENQF